ncbi:MAG TPA: recombination protein RecR [bacterium]|nr:recombination protein RecR [bacterium]
MIRNEVRKLIEELTKLPGISLKIAHKVAYSVLNDSSLKDVLKNIYTISDNIEICPNCGFFKSKEDRCVNCSEKTDEICVVATYSDMSAIERSGCFRGSYHILGGLITPLENILPEDLLVDQLRKRVELNQGVEVLLALPFSIEGDATVIYIQDVLSGLKVNLSRIARGLPAGAALDVLDRRTVLEALQGRSYID